VSQPPLRLRWSDFDRSGQVPFPTKVREELVRDQILDWLRFQKQCMAWWNEPHSVLRRKAGKLVMHAPANRHFKTGIPDILGSWKGRPLAIEVKRPKAPGADPGVLREGQIAFMHEARAQGWIAFVAWRLEDVKTCLLEFETSLSL
jgi:hypothetical protein